MTFTIGGTPDRRVPRGFLLSGRFGVLQGAML
jgi:hypothetical protein